MTNDAFQIKDDKKLWIESLFKIPFQMLPQWLIKMRNEYIYIYHKYTCDSLNLSLALQKNIWYKAQTPKVKPKISIVYYNISCESVQIGPH